MFVMTSSSCYRFDIQTSYSVVTVGVVSRVLQARGASSRGPVPGKRVIHDQIRLRLPRWERH
jgi:hypothetical protein